MARTLPRLAAAALILALTGAAVAQDSPAQPVLAGPKVDVPAHATSLVERDETGRVKRLDIPAGEAALALLDLEKADMAKARAVLDARGAILDGIVIESLTLLVELQNAAQSKDQAETRRLGRELAARAQPLRARGSLERELADVLPAEKAARLEELVAEYNQALVAELRSTTERNDATMTDDAPARRRARQGGALQAEAAAAFGREIKRSYERVVTSRVKEFDELLKDLALAPEVEADIRRLATDSFQKTEGKATPAQRAELFSQIYLRLNSEQRRKLAERFRAGEKK